MLSLLFANHPSHEAAPVQWDRDANCHLIQADVALQTETESLSVLLLHPELQHHVRAMQGLLSTVACVHCWLANKSCVPQPWAIDSSGFCGCMPTHEGISSYCLVPRTCSVMTRMSQHRERQQPPAGQAPLMAAKVTSGERYRRARNTLEVTQKSVYLPDGTPFQLDESALQHLRDTISCKLRVPAMLPWKTSRDTPEKVLVSAIYSCSSGMPARSRGMPGDGCLRCIQLLDVIACSEDLALKP